MQSSLLAVAVLKVFNNLAAESVLYIASSGSGLTMSMFPAYFCDVKAYNNAVSLRDGSACLRFWNSSFVLGPKSQTEAFLAVRRELRLADGSSEDMNNFDPPLPIWATSWSWIHGGRRL